MRNKILVAILGISVAVMSVIVDYVYTNSVFEERFEEYSRYENLNADPHTHYSGFTVEQFGEGYEKPSELFGTVELDVPIINQMPELPVGCEPVCAVSVLQYLGYDIDKFTFIDNYLTCKWIK